jgi:hypothetical protein
MKCSNCWSRRIESANANILHKTLATIFLMKPVKCRHCFHSFHVPIWVSRRSDQNASGMKSGDEEVEAEVGPEIGPEIVPFSQVKQDADHQSDAASIRKAA